MIGISRLVEILRMAGVACRWGSAESSGMTFQAIGGQMSTCQGKTGLIVIKDIVSTARWMASQTSRTRVDITQSALMLVIRFGIKMAGQTSEIGILGRIVVAIGAGHPFTFVLATVNRKVLTVMIEGRWRPCRFRMAGYTIR